MKRGEELAMERATLEKLRSDAGLFERLDAQARRERNEAFGRVVATLRAVLFAPRAPRAAAHPPRRLEPARSTRRA